jgi:O-antigen/teichoic acid export membrane protein
MQKKFLGNIAILLVVNILVKPFWILGIDRMVQNNVGNEQYGQYAVLFNSALLFSMLLDFGINNYTATFIAQHRQLLDKTFSALLPLKLLFSFAYLVATMGLGIFYGLHKTQLLMLCVLGINQVMAFFILYFRANVSGLQLFKTDALLSVLDRGMMILAAVLFFWVFRGGITITAFMFLQSAGYLLSMLVSFLVLRPHLHGLQFRFDKAMMFTMMRNAWPFALLALIMTLYMRADYLLVKKLLPDGDIQNGIYAAANRLLDAANMMAVLVSTMLLPLFANMIKTRQELGPVVKTSMVILILPAICVSSVCWFFNIQVMNLLVKSNPLATAQVFKYVMISFTALCVMYIFGTLLTANRSLTILTRLAGAGLLINVTLNVLLLPRVGVVGAAIAAACTHGFIAISNTVFALRNISIGLGRLFLVKFAAIAACIIPFTYLCRHFEINVLITSLLLAVFVLAIALALRLLNIGQLRLILKRGS